MYISYYGFAPVQLLNMFHVSPYLFKSIPDMYAQCGISHIKIVRGTPPIFNIAKSASVYKQERHHGSGTKM